MQNLSFSHVVILPQPAAGVPPSHSPTPSTPANQGERIVRETVRKLVSEVKDSLIDEEGKKK